MTLLHLTAADMRELLEGHQIHTLAADESSLTVLCDAAEDEVDHLAMITGAALAFLHGDTWGEEDMAKLAQVLGVEREADEGGLAVHQARPGADANHCAVCGQEIQRLPDGGGVVYVHVDSGSVTALNPPGRQ